MKVRDKIVDGGYFWLILLVLIVVFLVGGLNKVKAQTYQEVRNYIYDSTDIEHKDIVLRQAILETGHFKCTGCSRDRNNIFGWYYKKKYLEFNHWKESVAYYSRWQKRHFKGGNYYDFLVERGYATDPNYINKLKSINL